MKTIVKIFGSPFSRDKEMIKDRTNFGKMATCQMTKKIITIADIEYRYHFVSGRNDLRWQCKIDKIVQCCTDIKDDTLKPIVKRVLAQGGTFERRIA